MQVTDERLAEILDVVAATGRRPDPDTGQYPDGLRAAGSGSALVALPGVSADEVQEFLDWQVRAADDAFIGRLADDLEAGRAARAADPG